MGLEGVCVCVCVRIEELEDETRGILAFVWGPRWTLGPAWESEVLDLKSVLP